MDQQQQETVLRSIAISAGIGSVPPTPSAMQESFRVLENFKAYEGNMSVCLQWLHQESIVLSSPTNADITVPTKLMSCSIVQDFLGKGYSKLASPDRLTLRHSVLTAARQVAPMEVTADARILGNKLAVLLQGLMVRDFPQRWPTFFEDVYSPMHAGGLWRNPNETVHVLGVKMCLETLRLVAEDCTDSDFNAKISTSRRNDVLIGLNEVSDRFLPLLFSILEHYSYLVQSKERLHGMRVYLLSNQRRLADMTPDESGAYQEALKQRDVAAKLIGDCLITLRQFCRSMPVEWILDTTKHGDFSVAFLHLLREPSVQVEAIQCIEELAIRKLENQQWFRLITDIPPAIQAATQAMNETEQEQRNVEQQLSGRNAAVDMLVLELPFHKALSRMLAITVANNISHITNDKGIVSVSMRLAVAIC